MVQLVISPKILELVETIDVCKGAISFWDSGKLPIKIF